MSNPPAGWTRCTIGSLCELINGRAFKPTDWTDNGLPIVRIQNLNNPEAPFNRFNGEVRSRFLIDSGALLFAWSGTPGTSFGCHIWNRGPAVLNQHIFNVIFDETKIDKDFFRFAINQKLDELIDKAHGGVGLRHVTKGKFEATEIDLPPFEEQRKLVARIDSLLRRSDAAKSDLDRIPRLAERCKQAILAAACSGDLTADWRREHASVTDASDLLANIFAVHEQSASRNRKTLEALRGQDILGDVAHLPPLPESWAWVPVSLLASRVTDGVHKKPAYVEQGIPFLTVRNLTAGPGIDFTGCRYVTKADHLEFIKRTHPECGDILITKDGTLGVVRAIRTDEVFSIFVSLALIKPIDRSMTDYLELALSSPQVQQQMVGVGTGLQHIHLTDLRRDLIPVAPADVRLQIVLRTRSLLKCLDDSLSEASRAANLLDRLEKAALAMAFRSELGPKQGAEPPVHREEVAAE